jgi:hypothetical protein
VSTGDDGRALDAEERTSLIAAHEGRVDALRNSPQYRVGELVIAAARSPRRLFRLPVDAWRLRKELLARHTVTPPPPRPERPTRTISVATILDECSHRALAPEWNQHPLSTPKAAGQLAAIGPSLVFVESAWEGNGGAFRDELADLTLRNPSLLSDVLSAAGELSIPTVFWNTEDPVHFDTFAPAAARFDWIYTTDEDCVPRYRERAGHDRVAALPFAAQPRIHNPVGAGGPKIDRACFAGSWPADHDAEGGVDVAILLRPVLDAGLLDIFDRVGPAGARFPRPYAKAVLGGRADGELLADYRRYACFLDANSVRSSPTMCSRRVFEVLACGTPVVSTPSRAIDELLAGTVITVDEPGDAREAVERLTGDVEYRERVGHLGYRAVMSRHTYGHRVDEVLGRLDLTPRRVQPRVAVLAATNRPEFLPRLLANFAAQHYTNAELVVITNSDRFDRSDVDEVVGALGNAKTIHLAEGLTLGECLNAGLDATDARFIAKFDDDDHYGPDYLADALLVHQFVDAAIVGKKTFYAHLEGPDETILRFPGNEFTFANRVTGSTLVIDRSIFDNVRFAPLNLGEDGDLFDRAHARGLSVFSADRYNYIAARRADVGTHSWSMSDADFRIGSVRVAPGLALDRTMI